MERRVHLVWSGLPTRATATGYSRSDIKSAAAYVGRIGELSRWTQDELATEIDDINTRRMVFRLGGTIASIGLDVDRNGIFGFPDGCKMPAGGPSGAP